MFYREAGSFKTSYAADMAMLPDSGARWAAVAFAVLFVFVVPLVCGEYLMTIFNLILLAVVGAIGLNILVGYTDQVSIGQGAFMSVGAYTGGPPDHPTGCAVLDRCPGRRIDGGADRCAGGHPVAAHQGAVSRHRHARRAVDHPVDDQPRAVHFRRQRGNDPGAAAGAVRHEAAQPGADVSVPAVLRGVGYGGRAEPDPQPDRPRLHRDPRPGYRRRDHRHRHFPLQALGVRDFLVLRGRHWSAVHATISGLRTTSNSNSTYRSASWRW